MQSGFEQKQLLSRTPKISSKKSPWDLSRQIGKRAFTGGIIRIRSGWGTKNAAGRTGRGGICLPLPAGQADPLKMLETQRDALRGGGATWTAAAMPIISPALGGEGPFLKGRRQKGLWGIMSVGGDFAKGGRGELGSWKIWPRNAAEFGPARQESKNLFWVRFARRPRIGDKPTKI